MLAAKEHASDLERLAALVERGQLVSIIDRRIPLDAVPAALSDLEAGRVRGKVAIQIA